jgi:hypothetical protein
MFLAMVLGITILPFPLAAQDEDQQQEQPNQNKAETEKGHQESVHRQSASDSVSAYRLDFTITEFDDGKKINARNYSLLAQVGFSPSMLRIGGRMPVRIQGSSNTPPQFQYFDLGMNIDCSVREKDGALILDTRIDSSSMAPQVEESTHQPIERQWRSEVRSVVNPGKPTVILSMEDPTSKGKFQVEVTATKMH